MSKILELRQKRATTWDAAKKFLDDHRGEDGLVSPEDTTAYEKMEQEVVDLGREIERLERVDALDRELSRPLNSPLTSKPEVLEDEKTGRAANAYNSAFWRYARNRAVPYEVRDSLHIGEDGQGGYLVPDEFERTLVDRLQDANVIRGLAHVIRTASGDRKIPIVASKGTASWVDEEGTIPESDDSFGQLTIGAHKVATIIKVSSELLNDSVFDIEAYIASEFARRIGCAEEDAFINGDGVGKPTGLLHNTNGAELGVTAASTTQLVSDELIDLIHSLRVPYRRNAVFLLNDATIKLIRKLKDSNGQYLWQPGLKEGQPDMLLNHRIINSVFMPLTEPGKKAVLFGDLNQYWVADRQGRSFKRLNELFATTDQVGFVASQRVDGRLVLPEAIKALQMKAS